MRHSCVCFTPTGGHRRVPSLEHRARCSRPCRTLLVQSGRRRVSRAQQGCYARVGQPAATHSSPSGQDGAKSATYETWRSSRSLESRRAPRGRPRGQRCCLGSRRRNWRTRGPEIPSPDSRRRTRSICSRSASDAQLFRPVRGYAYLRQRHRPNHTRPMVHNAVG